MGVRRLLPRSIATSLMLVYSDGAGVVPKGKQRHRKASLPTIMMHVESICALAWMRRYEASKYVFPIRIRFEGHLMCMDEIMWNILRKQNP